MATKIFQLFSCIFLISLVLPLLSHAKSPPKPKAEKPSPFEYIKHLEGCRKGENVKGLNQLKTYLEKFGYLNPNTTQNQTNANVDDFDDSLEAAIKTYQLNHRLEASGTLDAHTVSKMSTPRCGVPDIVNGTNWMQERRKPGRSLNTVAHFSFFPGNPKWPADQTQLTYGFLSGTNSDAVGAVGRAFDKWASVSQFTFSQGDFESSDIKIGFYRLDHGDGDSFDGPGGTLAHSFAPTDGRFHYDADESWSVGAVPGSYDLETVGLHQIGHLLGLGHSSVQDAIMYPSISSGVTKGLNDDDIQGLKALYNNNVLERGVLYLTCHME